MLVRGNYLLLRFFTSYIHAGSTIDPLVLYPTLVTMLNGNYIHEITRGFGQLLLLTTKTSQRSGIPSNQCSMH